jgi:hypothetical protein
VLLPGPAKGRRVAMASQDQNDPFFRLEFLFFKLMLLIIFIVLGAEYTWDKIGPFVLEIMHAFKLIE